MMDSTVVLVSMMAVVAVALYALFSNPSNKIGPYIVGLALLLLCIPLVAFLVIIDKVKFDFGTFIFSIIGFSLGLIANKASGKASIKRLSGRKTNQIG